MNVEDLSIDKTTKGLTGSMLKLIAILSMLIDHIGAVVIWKMIRYSNGGNTEDLTAIYYCFRLIGRLGFPIFIFLLIQGVEHTRNKWKYFIRLLVFALISEIPFDFAFQLSAEQIASGQLIEGDYQNVFFTLSIGLLCIIGIQKVEKTKWNNVIMIICQFGITGLGMGLAELMHTDYGDIGVLAIVVMYLLRRTPIWAAVSACVVLLFSSTWELSAFLILLPLARYNGKRGWKLKWLFYVFYPAHLFLLWLVCLWLGIA